MRMPPAFHEPLRPARPRHRGLPSLEPGAMAQAGALRCHRADACRPGEVVPVRTLARLGLDVCVGIGPSITVAAPACAQITGAGAVLTVTPDQVAEFLAPLPVEALHGPARPRPCTTTACTAS